MVEHDEKTKSFYLLEDGYKAFICYEVQNGEFDVLTTQVPKAISGRGLASQLMKACASFVKEKGLFTSKDYQSEKENIIFYRELLLKELRKRDKEKNN